MEKRKSFPRHDFTSGMLLMFCIQQMSMDLIGKADYGRYVTLFWTETRWWYWPLLFIGWSVLVRFIEHRSRALEQRRWRLFGMLHKAKKDGLL